MPDDIFHDRQARGQTRTGWLQSFHTFSFGFFNDPARMGFRALRVINEDVIAGGSGFAEHAHDHFEILTFMLSGRLEHRDTAGNEGLLGPGDVQLMSSGLGVSHSERNPAAESATHLFQVWLHGNADSLPPRYQHARACLDAAEGETVRLVASPDGRQGSLQLRADVRIWGGVAAADTTVQHGLEAGRYGWLQCLEGAIEAEVPGEPSVFELRGGDALQLGTVTSARMRTMTQARWLWFDLD
jgi:redox-sensitive bicupin YhaK (pirin superfamily)